jgi:hypothetical protein
MKSVILNIEFASDGIVVEFDGGTRCYYSANFLLASTDQSTNCAFLDHDPTPEETRLRHPDLTFSALAAQILPYQNN